MENPSSSGSRRWNKAGIGMEDNMLAMLDAFDSQDAVDDSGSDDSKPSSNSPSKLVVAEEAWSPIIICQDNVTAVSEAGDKECGRPLDPSSFQLLIEELAGVLPQTQFELSNLKGSRKTIYKGLVKDCMKVICQLSQFQNELNKYELQRSSESQLPKYCHTALFLALPEVVKNTCVSMEKLLVMIMGLDLSKKKADIEGHTTRADGTRTPVMDIILDELAYSEDTVPLFLKIFTEPRWKLEIVVQYLWKYITKPSVRTRKTSGSTYDSTFHGALRCFSNKTGTKSIIKKMGADVVQFLLAHGFQAQLSILGEGNTYAGDQEGRANALADLCQMFISAFDSLRSTNQHMEILPIGKEALFTAATVILMKS
ncbi:hypothetical protein TanjilG_27408 [Lupinus angustifolius]|uniref:Uncharacterized protein n=1 Tax=Lupinus angustifolius TaxID=3871 RepID=A0A1J7FYM5_LUPAN|nr:hypothetical protein TanjilG_27408 [Lupinus angustifolius]